MHTLLHINGELELKKNNSLLIKKGGNWKSSNIQDMSFARYFKKLIENKLNECEAIITYSKITHQRRYVMISILSEIQNDPSRATFVSPAQYCAEAKQEFGDFLIISND